jgi:hypothetical protein
MRTGVLNFDKTSSSPQDLFEQVISTQTRISAIWIDPFGLDLSDVTFTLYVKLGATGTDYRPIIAFNNSDAPGNSFNLIAASLLMGSNGIIEVDTPIKITAQSFAGGGVGSVYIYFRMPYEEVTPKKFLSGAVYMSTDGVETVAAGFAGEVTAPIQIVEDSFGAAEDTVHFAVAAVVAANNKINEIRISKNSGVNLADTGASYNFMKVVGIGPAVDSKDVGAAYPSFSIRKNNTTGNIYERLQISSKAGTTNSTRILYPQFRDCLLDTDLNICGADIENCENTGALLPVKAADNSFKNIFIHNTRFTLDPSVPVWQSSGLDGFSITGLALAGFIRIDNCFGRLWIHRITDALLSIVIDGFFGELYIDATCSAGSIRVRGGAGKITIEPGVLTTVVVDGFIENTTLDPEGFSNGFVYCDYSNGESGTADPVGKKNHPAVTLDNAVTIANANKMRKISLYLGGNNPTIGNNVLSGKHVIGIGSVHESSLMSVVGSGYDVVLENVRMQSSGLGQEPLHNMILVNCRIVSTLVTDRGTIDGCVFEANTTLKVFGLIPGNKTNIINSAFYPTTTIDGSSFQDTMVLQLDGCYGRVILINFTYAALINISRFTGQLIIASSCNANPIITIVGGSGKIQNLSVNVPTVYGFTPSMLREDLSYLPAAQSNSIDSKMDTAAAILLLLRKVTTNRKAIKKILGEYFQIVYDDNDSTEILNQLLLTFDEETIGELAGTTKPSIKEKSTV